MNHRPFDIEHIAITSDQQPTYEGYLRLISQAIFEFRSHHPGPRDLDKPMIHTYKAPSNAIVTLISTSETTITVQVESNDQGRLGYVYDEGAEQPLVINIYDNERGNEPAQSSAPIPSYENLPILLDVYDYIQSGTTDLH